MLLITTWYLRYRVGALENVAVCWHSKKPHKLDKFHVPSALVLLLEWERDIEGVFH